MTSKQKDLEVALKHRWLAKIRGDEKALEQFSNLFPSVPIHSLVAKKEKLWQLSQRHSLPVPSKELELMTGRPGFVSPREGIEDGAGDFLLKLFSHEALPNCLKT